MTRPAETPGERAANIQTKELRYTVGDESFVGFLAWDGNRGDPRPGVLVVHEWWGHNDYTRRRARMLAELGYTALALDMYGDGKKAEHPKEAQEFSTAALADLDRAVERFAAAKKLLEGHPTTDPEKTAAIGYCFGGGVVLHMARIGMDLDGVASFHGSLGARSTAEKGQVKARILVLHGAADELVSEEQVEKLRAEMKAAEADLKVVSYPGAKHAFTNPAADAKAEEFGLPLGYDAQADEKSWQELVGFLRELW